MFLIFTRLPATNGRERGFIVARNCVELAINTKRILSFGANKKRAHCDAPLPLHRVWTFTSWKPPLHHVYFLLFALVVSYFLLPTSKPTPSLIRSSTILALDNTPGKPAPGWVPAPTKNRFGNSSDWLCGRNQAD